jgi:hypothetical protein
MTSPLNPTPRQDFYIHRGAPKAIAFQVREDGTLRALDASITLRVTHPTGTFDLAVGSGITLSTAESVANALATCLFTVAQSRLVPVGRLSTFEVQETVSGQERIVFMGSLIGVGGDNADA